MQLPAKERNNLNFKLAARNHLLHPDLSTDTFTPAEVGDRFTVIVKDYAKNNSLMGNLNPSLYHVASVILVDQEPVYQTNAHNYTTNVCSFNLISCMVGGVGWGLNT